MYERPEWEDVILLQDEEPPGLFPEFASGVERCEGGPEESLSPPPPPLRD